MMLLGGSPETYYYSSETYYYYYSSEAYWMLLGVLAVLANAKEDQFYFSINIFIWLFVCLYFYVWVGLP